MTVDRAWVKQNLGIDLIQKPLPEAVYAFKPAARPQAQSEDIQREIIDFDSEGPEGQAFLALSTATGLSKFEPIPWPAGKGPATDSEAHKGVNGSLPNADVLVVTWTVDEGHALSRVLTPGKDSRNDYLSYTHNFATISKKMRAGCPAIKAGRLGAYWTTSITGKSVVVFKSDSHMSQDTEKSKPPPNVTLPNEDVWKQIISEVNPRLVITTGTAGGIGTQCEVGDVVVSPIVRFDTQKWLNEPPYQGAIFEDAAPNEQFPIPLAGLIQVNAGQLPPANTRAPRIIFSTQPGASVVTTDFFGFDTSDDRLQLEGKGAACEMGDAILGLLATQTKARKWQWVAVRNVSDPQIKAEGTPKEQEHEATTIYKGYGRWSSVCSGIVCWALIAAL